MISNCFKVTMSIGAAVQLTYWSLNKQIVIIFKATLKEQILESYCQSSMAWKTTVKHPSLKFYFKAISLRGQCQSLMISQNCYLNKYTGIYHVLNSHKKYKNISTRIILWFVLNIFVFRENKGEQFFCLEGKLMRWSANQLQTQEYVAILTYSW